MAQTAQYSKVAIILHWVIAIVLLGQIFYGFTLEDLPRAERFAAMQSHKSMGLTILALVLMRILWRIGHRPPPLGGHLKKWEVGLAHGTHWGLYALMLAVPISGYVLISSAPYKIATKWWGLFEVPVAALGELPFAKQLHEGAEVAHAAMAVAILALVGIHLLGALKHQFIDKDDTLARMVPFLARKSKE